MEVDHSCERGAPAQRVEGDWADAEDREPKVDGGDRGVPREAVLRPTVYITVDIYQSTQDQL